MGAGYSRGLYRLIGMDQGSDSPQRRSAFGGNFNEEGDPDLPSIVGYLIRR